MLSVETSFCSGFDVATVTDALIKKQTVENSSDPYFCLAFLFCVGFFSLWSPLFFLSVICQTIINLCKMVLDSKIEHLRFLM